MQYYLPNIKASSKILVHCTVLITLIFAEICMEKCPTVFHISLLEIYEAGEIFCGVNRLLKILHNFRVIKKNNAIENRNNRIDQVYAFACYYFLGGKSWS